MTPPPAQEEETDDRLVKILDEAVDLLSKFVVPLYIDKRGRPSQFGTGFFVRSNSTCFLVSAAHVLEHGTSLYYYIEPNVTATLSGERRLSRWAGDRNDDPVDIGVIKLKESYPPYPAVDKTAIEVSYLRSQLLPRTDKVYAVLGFPGTQSKINPVDKQVSTTLYAFRERSIPDQDYESLGCSPESHVVLSVDLKDGVDSQGRQRTLPKPQGMSGSPIFMMLDENPRTETRSFPIVAIGTKYRKHKKAMIGTDVGIALAMINEAISR